MKILETFRIDNEKREKKEKRKNGSGNFTSMEKFIRYVIEIKKKITLRRTFLFIYCFFFGY